MILIFEVGRRAKLSSPPEKFFRRALPSEPIIYSLSKQYPDQSHYEQQYHKGWDDIKRVAPIPVHTGIERHMRPERRIRCKVPNQFIRDFRLFAARPASVLAHRETSFAGSILGVSLCNRRHVGISLYTCELVITSVDPLQLWQRNGRSV